LTKTAVVRTGGPPEQRYSRYRGERDVLERFAFAVLGD
jgi:hypothetical protein